MQICYNKTMNTSTLIITKENAMYTPIPCKGGCGKLLRTKKYSKADLPETILNYGFGYCRSCKPVTETKKPPIRYSHCVKCKREMRRWNETSSDKPGTIRESGLGTCEMCYRKELRLRKESLGLLPINDEESVSPAFDVEQARKDLEAWLEERRKRLAERRDYPVKDLVIQYNPRNKVAVITRAGNPVGVSFGLHNGFRLATQINTKD